MEVCSAMSSWTRSGSRCSALRGFTQALRSVPLTNDVEPFSTFRPYRGD